MNAQRLTSIEANRSSFGSTQEHVNLTCEGVFNNIAAENEVRKCRELVVNHSKALESQLMQDLDVTNLPLPATSAIGSVLVHSQTVVPQATVSDSATTTSKEAIAKSDKISVIDVIATAYSDVYHLQSQFDSYNVNGSANAMSRSFVQKLAMKQTEIITLCNQHQQNFLDTLDTELAKARGFHRPGDVRSKPLLDVHDHRVYRQQVSLTNDVLTQLFLSTIQQFEAPVTSPEQELGEVRSKQAIFCENALHAMNVKIEGNQMQCEEIAQLFVDVIKTSNHARLRSIEILRKIYAVIQKDHVQNSVACLKEICSMLMEQQVICTQTLFSTLRSSGNDWLENR